MPCQLLMDFLQRAGAVYQLHHHDRAYTALEVAKSSHVEGRSLVKVVMVKADMDLVMVVMPAHYHVELALLAEVLQADHVSLAPEREFSRRFPRCEVGAIPPFGHLYGVQTFMVPVFDEQSPVAVSSGSHDLLLLMDFLEYRRLSGALEIPQGVAPPSEVLQLGEGLGQYWRGRR